MKRSPLKRKTPLRVKTHPKRSKLRQVKRKKPKVPTITKLKKLLWEECKRIVRQRHGLTCYTCGLPCEHPHTGHFIPSSVCSVYMRYSLENLRPQCYRCNINLSGNWIEFEKRLWEKERMNADQLKIMNEDTKGLQYDRTWYEQKLAEYKQL